LTFFGRQEAGAIRCQREKRWFRTEHYVNLTYTRAAKHQHSDPAT